LIDQLKIGKFANSRNSVPLTHLWDRSPQLFAAARFGACSYDLDHQIEATAGAAATSVQPRTQGLHKRPNRQVNTTRIVAEIG